MIASGNDRFDARQWRALTRAYLVTDHAALLGGHGRREQRGALVNLLTLGVVGLTASIGPALLVLLTRDRFAAAILMCTSIGMTTAVAVLGQASSLASPEDLEIVGCRPVGSRTYFAVRATSLVLNTAFTLLLTGALPVLAFLIRSGAPAVMLGAAAACAVTALTVALCALVLHGILVRTVDAHRLSSALATTNVTLMLALVGAYLWGFAKLVDRSTGLPLNLEFAIDKSGWVLLYPAAWFAALVEIAAGSRTAIDLAGVGLSLGALALLGWALRGGLAATYAARVAELGVQPQAPSVLTSTALPGLRGEARVVLTLCRAQAAADPTVKMNLLMSVCFFFGFLLLTALDRLPSDPFAAGSNGTYGAFGLIGLLMIGPILYQSSIPSASAGAAWFLFSTPADHATVIRATRDLIFACVLLPLTAVVAVFLTYAYRHVGHALAQAAVAGAMAYVTLQVAVLSRPRLPFAGPMAGRRAFGGGGLVLLTGALSAPLLLLLEHVLCRSYARVGIGLAGLAVVMVLLDRLTRWRIRSRPALIEYTA